MKTLFYTGLLMCALGTSAWAQPQARLRGQTHSADGKPMEFVTVMLLKATDSSLVKGALSDVAGAYEFSQIKAGQYLVAASQVGYQKTYSQSFALAEGQNLNLDALKLAEATQALKEVVISAQKPLIEQKNGALIVNVENSIVGTGSTALEVLERAPGVTVDQDGNISLKGKSAVRVMVDGKPTYMSSTDLANMLRNMQSNQIAQVEIMTNPSAKYDAAGNAGIINIKLKKNQKIGLNGSVNANFAHGRFRREGAGTNLNYRNGNLNIFGDYNYGSRRDFQNQFIGRKFYENQQLASIYEQDAYYKRHSYSHNGKFGIDYSLGKNTTIGVLGTSTSGIWQQNGDNVTDIANGSHQMQSQTITPNTIDSDWFNYTTNLNVKHSFDSSGRELVADLDYAHYGNGSEQHYLSRYINANGQPIAPNYPLDGNSKTGIDIYSAKADYIHPLNAKNKFEIGVKTSSVSSDNSIKFTTANENGQVIVDEGKTNQFKYTENINAAYINFSSQLGKTSVQLGLRGEQTVAKGNQITTDSTFTRRYVQLFPNVAVQRNINAKNQLAFTYSRRIDRPNYEDLNPFLYFLDPYTYQVGNPYLKPQFTNNLELTHTFNNFLNTTVNYSHTDNGMMEVLKQNDAEKTTYQTNENLGKIQNYGLAVSASVPVAKWLMSSNYVNVYHSMLEGQFGGAYFDKSFTAMHLNSTNNIMLPNDWSVEVGGFYNSRALYGSLQMKAQGALNIGVQKKVLAGKGVLKLGVRDIFRTQRFRGTMLYNNIDARFSNYFDSRSVNASFTYRFGNSKVAAARRRATGLEDEQRRVKGGN